jgi:hypothetical protein
MIELLVIILLFIVCACILIPSIARNRRDALARRCQANLKQIGLAFRTWDLSGDLYPQQIKQTYGGTMELAASGQVFVHFRVMSNELKTPDVLTCLQIRQKSAPQTSARDLATPT